jgi:hypothetical protein
MTTAETQPGQSEDEEAPKETERIMGKIAKIRGSISRYEKEGNHRMAATLYLTLAKTLADANMKDELAKTVAEIEPLIMADIEGDISRDDKFGSASSRDKFGDALFKVGRTEDAKAMKLLAAKDYYLYVHTERWISASDGFRLKDAARCYREADVPGESEAGNEMCANGAADIFLKEAENEEKKSGARWYNDVLMHIEWAIDALVEGNQTDRARSVAKDFGNRFFERYGHHVKEKSWYSAEEDLEQIEHAGKQVKLRDMMEKAKAEKEWLKQAKRTQGKIDRKRRVLLRAESRVHDTALNVFHKVTDRGEPKVGAKRDKMVST